MTKQLQALAVSVRHSASRMIALSPNIPEEASVLLENIEEPSALADFLAANLSMNLAQRQALLEELDPGKRLETISVVLAHQLEVLEISHKIQGRVRESIDKSQREYFLQEQMKAIQKELGQQEPDRGIESCARRSPRPGCRKAVADEALRELDRLTKIPAASPEYTVIRTYLDWMCELPWSVQTEDKLDISQRREDPQRDHYDLEKVKKRILEFLAVRKLNPDRQARSCASSGPRAWARPRWASPSPGRWAASSSA